MRFPQGAEWLVILLLILVLFGAKRLPDAARGLGRSLRILKSETKGLREDDTTDASVTDLTKHEQPAPQQVTGAPTSVAAETPPATAVPAPPPSAANPPA